MNNPSLNLPQLLATLLLFFFSPNIISAQKHTISGFVYDESSGEALIGASVYDINTYQGTATNNYGFFSLTLPADSVHLKVSYIGYSSFEQSLFLTGDLVMKVNLTSSFNLDEIEIKADKIDRIEERTQMSTITLPVEQIKKLPAFMGEVDVLKTIQLLPGVQSGTEGSSGLYVRGGSPDQNLILLDGVPVYNVSHLFGFFSVFNADAINNVKLIKGGFPARYGGRLSSVLEINMKEGNAKEFHGEGSIGLIASKLTLEGPIIKDKASFILSGRRTYIDILAQPIIRSESDGDVTAGYFFYDLNGKVNYRISDKDRLYLSAYMGNDKFYFSEKYNYNSGNTIYSERYAGRLQWGNITSVLRWNHQYNSKLFSNATINYSRYNFDTGIDEEITEKTGSQEEHESFHLKYFSGIEDWSAKLDFDYLPGPNHFIKFGAGATYHTFKPGAIQFELDITGSPSIDTTLGDDFTRATEFALYIEDDLKVSQRLKANIGIHGSGFLVDNRLFTSVQPRFSARYMLAENFSAKLSFATMAQYIHLLTNSGIGLPTDLWVPATKEVKPEHSQQIAGGFAHTFGTGFEISLEGYYKNMQNIIEYKDGANFLDNRSDWQKQVESGRGWSYGAELFLQKKEGSTTGWVGYTLSWTKRQFENLNFGNVFPFKYDRRHDISVALVHDLGSGITLSGTWVYGTGNAISMPLARYPAESDNIWGWFEEVYYYKERNGYRMRAYHRLDLGISFRKEKKWGERTWNISAYNAYNRKNPFFIYLGWDERTNTEAFKQVSLFPILPSISYSFKF